MMLGSGHLISGFDVATGTFMLMLFSAGVAALVVAILVRFVVRRAGQNGIASVFWVCGLALVGTMLVYALLERSTKNDQAAERRAIETRAAELTARSLASGSALSCLDAVANTLVEDACERPLFASPEAIAAAVAYVDARLSLLAASAPLAGRDPSYQPVFERLRRGLEADRYGLVAHVLMTRGCNGADCVELRLLRDPARVVANMKSHVFEASISAHALAWPANGSGASAQASVAPASAPPLTSPQATTGANLRTPTLSSAPPAAAPPGSAKFDFPSANSIPPVSIMNAEPSAPPDAEPRPAPAPKRPAPAPRRQTAKEATPATPPPLPQRGAQPAPPPPPPVQVAPEIAAPPEPAVHDPHATR